MIITKEVKVKVKGNSKIKYFLENGRKIGNDILIDVKYLLPNSSNIIEVICDFCKSKKETKYSNYYRNINRNSLGRYACSLKCSKNKKEFTNLIKYGETHPNKNLKIREKIRETNLKKYGSEYTFNSEVIKDKIRETNLERHGVDNPFKSEEIKKKIKDTNLERHGVDNPFKSEEIKKKIKDTNLEKYGSEFIVTSDIFYNKIDIIREKIKKTHLDKYNLKHFSISEVYRKKFTKIANDLDYIKYLNDGFSLFKCEKGHEFQIKSDNYSSRISNNIPICTICNPIGDSQSIKEKELFEYIRSIYDGEIIQSYRDIMEIDIYLPNLKIGFEFNGLYFHSDKYKDKWYHLNKTKYFKEKDIKIIHIWEDDWINKKSIVKSQIRNLINKNFIKIFARKCDIVEVDSKNSNCFLNENHIQGSDRSSVKIGLYYNNKLVSLMTFDRFEGRKKMPEGEWNISRFCSNLNSSVIGGASKLLRYFIKKYKPSRLISYSDRDWSVGDLYFNLKFNKLYETKPDYKYIFKGVRVNKSRFRKSKLKTELTESEYMRNININKVWDCGKVKFEMIIN
jgi:hypothetical protein